MRKDIDFSISKKSLGSIQRLINNYSIYEMLEEKEKEEVSNAIGNSFFNKILMGKYHSIFIPFETFYFPDIQKINVKRIAKSDERIFLFKRTPNVMKQIENLYKTQCLVSGEKNFNIEMFIQNKFIEEGLSKIGMNVTKKKIYIDHECCYIQITGDICINSLFLNMCFLDNPIINSIFPSSIVKERQKFVSANANGSTLQDITFKARGEDLYRFLKSVEVNNNTVDYIQEEYNKIETSLKQILDKCGIKIEKLLHVKGEFALIHLDFSNSTLQLKDVLKTEVSPQLKYVFYHSVCNKDVTMPFSNIKMLINEISRAGGAHNKWSQGNKILENEFKKLSSYL